MMDSWPVKIGLAGSVLALVLSCIMIPQFKAANPQSTDVLLQVMGGTADFAADEAYQEADVYFHGGIRGMHDDKDGHKIDDGVQTTGYQQANLPLMDWMERMHSATTPNAHLHLEGVESKEMLPWFVVAVRLNPHLVEAWSTGMYWYYRSGEIEQSEKFASDGIRNNPNDYRLYFDRGVLYYHMKKWNSAVRDLEFAQKHWKNINEDSPYDLKAIQRYTGYARHHATLADHQ